jgi:hypothetical protein
MNDFFFADPPRHRDDFRVVLPRLFCEDRSEEEPQICEMRSEHDSNVKGQPRAAMPGTECASGPTTLCTVS